MVSEKDVEHIAELADIGISREELTEFTGQFNEILDYFDILDQVEGTGIWEQDLANIFREDNIEPSIPQEEVLANAKESEEGFFRAPRVM